MEGRVGGEGRGLLRERLGRREKILRAVVVDVELAEVLFWVAGESVRMVKKGGVRRRRRQVLKYTLRQAA